MKAIDVLKILRDAFSICPNSDDKGKRPVSNKQLERWLNNKSIIINGIKPQAHEDVGEPYFGFDSLVFFPRNPEKRVTVI